MDNYWRLLMLHDPEWVVTRPAPGFKRSDLRALTVLAVLLGILLAYLALHRPNTAFIGANSYIYNECPTGARIVVRDWGDNIFTVFEIVGDKRYAIGHYSPRSEALAVASRTCNN